MCLSNRKSLVRDRNWPQSPDILKVMLRYHVAYFLPRAPDRMVVAEVLDFPGVASQGFDLADARTMIAGRDR
jgi:hypothetical protein